MPKYIFFDLDDTLTPSRTPMAAGHVHSFIHLCENKDVVVVSGAEESQVKKQIPREADGLYYILSQNGNYATDRNGELLWGEKFSKEQEEAIFVFINSVHDELALDVRDENDLVEHRGSQISYSLIGHNESREIKKAFDPDASKRKAIFAARKKDVERLRSLGVEVVAGGTTCLDIFLLGKNKGFHVPRLIELKKWSKDDSLYIGDALQPGRNDEAMIGVISTHAVKNPDDTFRFITENLLS